MCHCFVLCVASQPNNDNTLPKLGLSRFGECVIVGIPCNKFMGMMVNEIVNKKKELKLSNALW